MSHVTVTPTAEVDPTPTVEPVVLVEPSVVPNPSDAVEVPAYPPRLVVGRSQYVALILATLIGMLAGFGVAFLLTLPRLRHHPEA